MKAFLKKLIKWTLLLLILLNAIIILTGKTYIYKGISNTYLKGKTGPSIDEYEIFYNREIKNAAVQEWPISRSYNVKQIPEKYLSDFNKYETVAFLVIKSDSILHEQYWDSYSSNSYSNSFSMAKTFVGILVGIALHEGKIKSLDEPVGNYIDKFKSGKNASLKIRHLLTMSSGINFDEHYSNPFAYPAAAYYGSDIKALTLKYDVVEDPGKVFKYISGNTEILAMILEKATKMPISNYLSEKLWKPIGARHKAYWNLDSENGMEKAYCCFISNARDFAKIGQLYLKNGNWNGVQLVPEQYVKESVMPAHLLNENGQKNEIYGNAWWLLNYKGHKIFYARGILGQYIFIIPEKNMVVVRLGKKRDKEYIQEHPKDIFIYLNAALEL